MAKDKACDPNCPAIARREFLGAAALTALAILEACGNGQIGPTEAGGSTAGVTTGGSTTTTTGGLVVKLSSYPALANTNGAARVDQGGSPIALVRTGASSFAAFSLKCPHEGFTVSVQSSRFYCPAHGAQFALTGTWTGGQRTSNLRSLTATYDAAAGTVTIK